MLIGYIYKITNMVNGKSYIGKTINGIGRKAITNCLTGRSKSAGGYKWVYKKGGIYE